MAYDDFRARYTALRALQAAQAQDQGEPPPTELERAHLFTGAAGVLLPLVQAGITGALCGLAAGVYAWLLKSPEAWRWGAGVAVGVIVIAWLAMLARWLNLTAPLERLTRIDLNQDGYIGSPPETIRIEVTSADRKNTTVAELPYPDRLGDFARGVLSGSPITERTWSGAGALFSQAEFRQIRDIMLARGWLRWSNPDAPNQGLELAPSGRAALRALAGSQSPTLERAEHNE